MDLRQSCNKTPLVILSQRHTGSVNPKSSFVVLIKGQKGYGYDEVVDSDG